MLLPVVVILILLAFLAAGMAMAFWSMAIVMKLVMSGFIGGLADAVVPGRLPYGPLGAVAAGIFGGVVGGTLLPSLGPPLFGVEIVPTFLGALAVVGIFEIVANTRSRAEL
ncbi:MAG: GlsB/YeaQ/YmgE family stress response membrane protein [Chloroflexi bacterium]|nr:GlsB/YeaQ/YmgE family stress response membrane protein [Chloroflexota bacterium]